MITYRDQVSFLEFLRPPHDFELEYCIGTTYSINVACIIAMAGMSTTRKLISSEPPHDEAYMAISDFNDKAIIFFQNCQIADFEKNALSSSSPAYQSVIKSLDSSLVPISPNGQRSSFHPKLWLIKFRDSIGKKPSLFRLLVTSRNLTPGISWEIGACLEGATNKTPDCVSVELSRFLSGLAPKVKKAQRARFKSAINDLKKLQFQLPKGINSLELLTQPAKKPLIKHFSPESYEGLTVVSPFIEKEVIEHLAKSKGFKLVTSRDSLSKVKTLSKLHASTFYVTAADNRYLKTEETPQAIGLHAKMYLALTKKETEVYLGSANCTVRGLHGANTEALVRLTGPKELYRSFQKNFIWESEKKHLLHPWLRPYAEPDKEEQLAELKMKEKEVALSEARSYFAAGKFQLKHSKSKGRSRLRFLASRGTYLPKGIKVQVCLLGMKWVGLKKCVASKGYSFQLSQQIKTDFVRIRVHYKGETRIFVTVAQSNLNAVQRNAGVVKHVFSATNGFLGYLSRLLQVKELWKSGGKTLKRGPKVSKKGFLHANEPAVLETLLLNAASDERRMEKINEVLSSEFKKDREAIRFRKFWRTFYESTQEVKQSRKRAA